MPLYLVELQPPEPGRAVVDDLLRRVAPALSARGAELLEAHVRSSFERLYLIVGGPRAETARKALASGGIEFDDIAEVRLVGADLADVRRLARRQSARFLVEWDLPDGLTMDSYLERKRQRTPLYATVPETTFLRTYVREDMEKCLCLYDAPDEAAVKRARAAVDAPIDRLHSLDPA